MSVKISTTGRLEEVLANQTILAIGDGSSPEKFIKLVDVIDVPDDIEGEYQTADRTNLTNLARVSKPTLQDNSGAKNFTVTYRPTRYNDIKALEGAIHNFKLLIGGPTGDNATEPEDGDEITPSATGWGKDGILSFSGELKIRFNGIKVGEYIENTLSIYMADKPVFSIAT